MTKEQARGLANECVNTLINAGVLEEQRDFFALDLITERIWVNMKTNNIDNPLPNETFTAAQAIEAVNRLLWSEGVQDDDFEDARVIKAFLVGTLPNISAPIKQ
tara:strand:+ start:223 stop:534 length:312 start_codon:yes stop_codon:yes gene_type:complete